ncbi:MAG: DNA mismatch repair endonuclease MutL [Fidelibacterota bacterium]
MPVITPLTEDLRNKISAGEVVERPASVVKELVENSLDAQADKIEIVLIRGGLDLIQVADNGHGIEPEDLPRCFQRYSTSKLSQMEDLFQIQTLGFRGEALASISSVAKVTVTSSSRLTEALDTWQVRCLDGTVSEPEPATGEKGTVFTVESLFYNTPARRKFLKSAKTELRHVLEVFKRFALSNPAVRFSLIADGKTLITVSPGSLEQRIIDLFDPTYHQKLLSVDFVKGDYAFRGFTGNLDLVKSRPGNQYLFLNGRFIKDRLLNSAVYGGFRSLIKRGEFPFFVINLTVPHNQVDVNVHPMKTEVRFQDEWRVYHVLKSAVEESLSDVLATIPAFTPPQEFHQHTSQLTFPSRSANPDFSSSAVQATERDRLRKTEEGSDLPYHTIDRAKSYAKELAGRSAEANAFETENIWQVHNKYIISQIESGLVIIDQHVAHERILYEEALVAMENTPMASQTLLFPEEFTFSPDDFSVLIDLIPALEKLGFRMRSSGHNTILLEAVPSNLTRGKEREVIIDILDHFIEQRKETASFQESLAASFACHAAIKAGDKLTRDEIYALVNRLFATKHPYYCPHGRPIIVQLSLAEMDERFER